MVEAAGPNPSAGEGFAEPWSGSAKLASGI